MYRNWKAKALNLDVSSVWCVLWWLKYVSVLRICNVRVKVFDTQWSERASGINCVSMSAAASVQPVQTSRLVWGTEEIHRWTHETKTYYNNWTKSFKNWNNTTEYKPLALFTALFSKPTKQWSNYAQCVLGVKSSHTAHLSATQDTSMAGQCT